MKMIIKYVIFIIISIISLIFVFYSTGKLIFFLSFQSKQITNTENDSTIWSLMVNIVLISGFMLQHTVMALPFYKKYMEKFGLTVISRSVYNLLASFVLMSLIKYWCVTNNFVFWNIDVNNSIVYYLFFSIHLFAWSAIYTGCLIMDLPEILGVKQVYYSIRKMPNPMDLKSKDLQRLYNHMRHPSFTAFCVILWVHPFMSLDRYLLASVLTAYMYFAWNPDSHDYSYQKFQYNRKVKELSHLH